MGGQDHQCDIQRGLKSGAVVPPTSDFVQCVAGGGGHKHGSAPKFGWETDRFLSPQMNQSVLTSILEVV